MSFQNDKQAEPMSTLRNVHVFQLETDSFYTREDLYDFFTELNEFSEILKETLHVCAKELRSQGTIVQWLS